MQALGVSQEQIVGAQTELDSNLATEPPSTPTIKILSPQEYFYFRKYKRGLESGLVMKESEAIKQNVIHTSQESVSRILFSRSTFDDPELTKSSPFVRANKYRPTIKTDKGDNELIPVAFGTFINGDDNDFQEDGSRSKLEEGYLVQNGINIKDGYYESSKERVGVEINDKAVKKFDKYRSPNDPVERMMCRMFPGYNKYVPVHAKNKIKEDSQTVR